MKELLLSERQEIAFKILCELHDICDKFKINYFLGYGTLIGAIRHQGYIPWDDDIDVWIAIDDYERLLTILARESSYKLLNSIDNKDWPAPFSKIYDAQTIERDEESKLDSKITKGVAVDLFPLFSCVDNKSWIKRITRYRNMSWRMFKLDNGLYPHQTIIEKIKYCYLRLQKKIGFDILYWKNKLLREEKSNKKTELVGCPISPYGSKDIYHKRAFEKRTKVVFGGRQFYAPSRWAEVLKHIYGDYMQLPPKEKRISHHKTRAYRL